MLARFEHLAEFKLDHHPKLMEEFCTLCVETTNKCSLQPIEKITLVGALVVNAKSRDRMILSDHDQDYLKHALTTCKRWQIPVSSKFTLTAMNRAFGERGDFLKNQPPTGLLVVCYIYDGPSASGPMCGQSPLHNVGGAWYAAAKKSGARIVLCYGGHGEINTTSFSPPEGEKNIYRPWESATLTDDWGGYSVGRYQERKNGSFEYVRLFEEARGDLQATKITSIFHKNLVAQLIIQEPN